MYQPRTYRHWIKDSDLISFNVAVKETDLYIRASHNLKAEALEAINTYRTPLEKYIESHPLFLASLKPCPVEEDAPAIIKEMIQVELWVNLLKQLDQHTQQRTNNTIIQIKTKYDQVNYYQIKNNILQQVPTKQYNTVNSEFIATINNY